MSCVSSIGIKRKKPDEQGEEDRLSWQMDPEDSCSDWTIIITVKGTPNYTYYVHKNILSVGPKKSDYFWSVFHRSGLYTEGKNHTSKIDLDDLSASAFPTMLDFQYSNNDVLNITHDNCVPLHLLGQYFGISSLGLKVVQFWDNELKLDKCVTCYQHSKLFRVDVAHLAIVKKCCKDWEGGDAVEDSALLGHVDVAFWLSVLEYSQGKQSRTLLLKFTQFCVKEKDRLGAENFKKLTDANLLPKLSQESATDLLIVERSIMASTGNVEATRNHLSTLQERCVTALVPYWHSFPRENIQTYCENWSSLVVSHISAGAAKHANAAKSCFPKSLVVSGAGTGAVNGTYLRTSNLYERAPRYTMDATWEGNAVQFQVYLYFSPDEVNGGSGAESQLSWYLSVLETVEKPSDGDLDFYCTHMLDKRGPCRCYPPRVGWYPTETMVGENPGPTVQPTWETLDLQRNQDWYL